jgi:hypothetical protein
MRGAAQYLGDWKKEMAFRHARVLGLWFEDLSVLNLKPEGHGGLVVGFGGPKLSFGSGRPILKFSTNFS